LDAAVSASVIVAGLQGYSAEGIVCVGDFRRAFDRHAAPGGYVLLNDSAQGIAGEGSIFRLYGRL